MALKEMRKPRAAQEEEWRFLGVCDHWGHKGRSLSRKKKSVKL